jgi:tetratricopeptide (TPR) repeat protein
LSRSINEADRANSFLNAGRPEEAQKLLSRHLTENPDDVRALCLMARALSETRNFEQALSASQAALKLAPGEEWAWRLASVAYVGLHDYPKARSAAEKAKELAPNLWIAHLQLVNVDIAFGRVTSRTQTLASELVRLAPNEPDSHMILGNVALQLKKPAAAEEAYRTALRIDPSHAGAKHNLSVAQLHRGKTGIAAAGFVDILSNDPQYALALRNLRASALVALRDIHVLLFFPLLLCSEPFARVVDQDVNVDPTFPWVELRLAIAVIAALSIGIYLLRFVHTSRNRLGQLVKNLPQIDKSLTVWAICLGVCFILVLTSPLLPAPVARVIYPNMMLFLFWFFIVMLAIAARRARKNR